MTETQNRKLLVSLLEGLVSLNKALYQLQTFVQQAQLCRWTGHGAAAPSLFHSSQRERELDGHCFSLWNPPSTPNFDYYHTSQPTHLPASCAFRHVSSAYAVVTNLHNLEGLVWASGERGREEEGVELIKILDASDKGSDCVSVISKTGRPFWLEVSLWAGVVLCSGQTPAPAIPVARSTHQGRASQHSGNYYKRLR